MALEFRARPLISAGECEIEVASETMLKLWCSVVQAELMRIQSEDYFDEIYEEYRSVGA